MANVVSIKLSGLDQVLSKLEFYSTLPPSEVIKPVLAEAGEILAKQMAENAPKDSGLLASDFNVKIHVDEHSGKAYVGVGYPEEYPLNRKEKK